MPTASSAEGIVLWEYVEYQGMECLNRNGEGKGHGGGWGWWEGKKENWVSVFNLVVICVCSTGKKGGLKDNSCLIGWYVSCTDLQLHKFAQS